MNCKCHVTDVNIKCPSIVCLVFTQLSTMHLHDKSSGMQVILGGQEVAENVT